MKRYTVQIPIAGKVTVDFVSDENRDKKEIIKRGLEVAYETEDFLDLDMEWDYYEIICEGNVFNGTLNEARYWEEECEDGWEGEDF